MVGGLFANKLLSNGNGASSCNEHLDNCAVKLELLNRLVVELSSSSSDISPVESVEFDVLSSPVTSSTELRDVIHVVCL